MVGWTTADHLRTDLVAAPLRNAWRSAACRPWGGLPFGSAASTPVPSTPRLAEELGVRLSVRTPGAVLGYSCLHAIHGPRLCRSHGGRDAVRSPQRRPESGQGDAEGRRGACRRTAISFYGFGLRPLAVTWPSRDLAMPRFVGESA